MAGFAHTTPESMPYTSSKHTIANLTRICCLLTALDRRASQIDIGNALTEMDQNITVGIPQADGSVRAEAVKDASHVANAVLHAASLPLDANLIHDGSPAKCRFWAGLLCQQYVG